MKKAAIKFGSCCEFERVIEKSQGAAGGLSGGNLRPRAVKELGAEELLGSRAICVSKKGFGARRT